jgi:hypothetical protein
MISLTQKRGGKTSMLRTHIKIGGMELEIDQGSHVCFRDGFSKDVYRDWDDLDAEAKEEIKNTIIKAEKLIGRSANALWR